jgi:hypothetical protein
VYILGAPREYRNQVTIMSDKKAENSRRKLLKTAVVGGGIIGASKAMPEKWSKPVVDSVLIPAHAATTGSGGGGGGGTTVGPTTTPDAGCTKKCDASIIDYINLDYEIV